MGWKGNVRAVSSALRAMERDAQRRHKRTLAENQRLVLGRLIQLLDPHRCGPKQQTHLKKS